MIALGVFLVVIGSLLSFTTLDDQYLGTNLDAVGYFLIALGVVLGVIGAVRRARVRRRTG